MKFVNAQASTHVLKFAWSLKVTTAVSRASRMPRQTLEKARICSLQIVKYSEADQGPDGLI